MFQRSISVNKDSLYVTVYHLLISKCCTCTKCSGWQLISNTKLVHAGADPGFQKGGAGHGVGTCLGRPILPGEGALEHYFWAWPLVKMALERRQVVKASLKLYRHVYVATQMSKRYLVLTQEAQ